MPRILLLLLFLFAGGSIQCLYAQSLLLKKVTLEKTVGTRAELLEELSEAGEFTFSYNSSLSLSDSIRLSQSKQTVRKFLDQIFYYDNIDYLEHNDYIVLRRSEDRPVYQFSGYVKLELSEVAVPGAFVYVTSLSKGTVTDENGYFELKEIPENFAMHISHISFQPQLHYVKLAKDSTATFYLSERSLDLPGLTISDRMLGDHIKKVEISKSEMTMGEIKAMPAMFGEVDILRSLQFLPGIHTGGDINAGLFVRGGASDQSLIQLNGATLYNPSHFGGLFSVFNPEVIRDVEIHKGSIPVRMGGRLSSVFNNHLKTGSKKEFKGAGGLGLISSRLTLEGPLIKDKASFIISGRRTYFDLFMGLSEDENLKNSNFYFYDLNGSVDVFFNPRNRVNLSFYKGSDVFKVQDIIGINWGNSIVTLNWYSAASDRLSMITNLSYTNFGYSFIADVKDELELLWYSSVRELNLKLDFDYRIHNSLTMNFGYQAIGHNFSPTYLSLKDNAASSGTVELDDKYALEQALYLGFEQDISEKLSLQYGLRYSIFKNIGPGKVLQYANDEDKTLDEVTDTLFYNKGQVINTTHGPEPRFVARYLLNETSAVKAGYSRTRQYIQMASNATAGNPTDRWIPSDTYIKPQTADQVSLGYFKNFLGGKIEASAEIYYRHMKNQIDFKEAVGIVNNIQNVDGSILLNNYLETRLLPGKSWAYGAEFLIKKQAGRFNGWLSYTLSKVQRQIEGINGGKPYSPRYDQTHDVSITANFEINSRLTMGANWVYNTGDAVTYPTGKYYYENRAVPLYPSDKRNQNRLPDYHRLDLSMTYKPKPRKERKWQNSWNFSIYNAYFRKNPVAMQFREVINDDPDINLDDGVPVVKRELKPVMVFFTIMPSVTYNFYF